MSQELERVYTIPLGKVKISQSQHRAVRAINMIREFARHHMKVETIKIEEELEYQRQIFELNRLDSLTKQLEDRKDK